MSKYPHLPPQAQTTELSLGYPIGEGKPQKAISKINTSINQDNQNQNLSISSRLI